MQITILTYGTRGDVMPYAAIGRQLRAAGHAVRLAAPEPFVTLALENELEFYPLPGDVEALVLRLVDEAGSNMLHRMRLYTQYSSSLIPPALAQCMAACEGSDAILHAFPLTLLGTWLAEGLGVPHMGLMVLPLLTPTNAFPLPVFGRNFSGWANRASHRLFMHAFGWINQRSYRRFVRPLYPHLPPLNVREFEKLPILYGSSPTLLPPPPDWSEFRQISGEWRVPTPGTYAPPPALQAFLAAGTAPIYIGFGSMLADRHAHVYSAVLKALQRSGQRAVLQGRWVAPLPESVFVLEQPVPHDWLFQRVAAVVQHGGVGTTTAALRAGKPTIVVPFTADQPFWGQRVHALGAGPAPIPVGELTGGKLAKAITQALTDRHMQQQAAALGLRMQAEDGLEGAVRVIVRELGI